MPKTMNDPMDAAMQKCIENCTECRDICQKTTAYCYSMGGKHAETAHLQYLLDCTEACAASASFMLRGSNLFPQVCGVCADACDRCAESCEQFSGDAQMMACAETCRRCGQSCRQMAAVTV